MFCWRPKIEVGHTEQALIIVVNGSSATLLAANQFNIILFRLLNRETWRNLL